MREREREREEKVKPEKWFPIRLGESFVAAQCQFIHLFFLFPLPFSFHFYSSPGSKNKKKELRNRLTASDRESRSKTYNDITGEMKMKTFFSFFLPSLSRPAPFFAQFDARWEYAMCVPFSFHPSLPPLRSLEYPHRAKHYGTRPDAKRAWARINNNNKKTSLSVKEKKQKMAMFIDSPSREPREKNEKGQRMGANWIITYRRERERERERERDNVCQTHFRTTKCSEG